MKYLNKATKRNKILKIKNSLLEFEIDLIELKGWKTKIRNEVEELFSKGLTYL